MSMKGIYTRKYSFYARTFPSCAFCIEFTFLAFIIKTVKQPNYKTLEYRNS